MRRRNRELGLQKLERYSPYVDLLVDYTHDQVGLEVCVSYLFDMSDTSYS